ncbi:uncharacterized protein LOC116603930 [Nematostella vectensis]|uniref:uncharacterized protein LOC116603930 n=1 Tax=Nematostella vectensis TaxID=45351 RepID=UPI002076DA32|nr:uncharacterized protein LOC116603930 [Nematostella vectensis]
MSWRFYHLWFLFLICLVGLCDLKLAPVDVKKSDRAITGERRNEEKWKDKNERHKDQGIATRVRAMESPVLRRSGITKTTSFYPVVKDTAKLYHRHKSSTNGPAFRRRERAFTKREAIQSDNERRIENEYELKRMDSVRLTNAQLSGRSEEIDLSDLLREAKFIRKRRAIAASAQLNSEISGNDTSGCAGYVSCRGKCSDRRAYQDDDLQRCFCDVSCELHGDCCAGYYTACNSSSGTRNLANDSSISHYAHTNASIPAFRSKHMEKSIWQCTASVNRKIWMIADCPEAWPRDKTSANCTKAPFYSNHLTAESYSYALPVFTRDGHVYRNKFCARCHGDVTVEPYGIAFDCSVMPPSDYSKEEQLRFLLAYCHSAIWIPLDRQPRRYCPLSKNSCPYNASEFLSRKCHSGATGLVVGAANTTYKNRFCAACNGERHVSCGSALFSGKQRGPFGSSGYHKPISPHGLSSKDFSLIFDFGENSRAEKTVSINCPEQTPIFDPYLEECRKGFVPSPRHAAFDSYKLCFHMRIEGSETISLSKKDFLEFGQVRFGVYRPMVSKFSITPLDERQIKVKFIIRTLGGTNFSMKFDLTEPIRFNTSNNSYLLFRVTKRVLTCVKLVEYHRSEYTILTDQSSAIYINQSGEVFKSHDFYFGKDDRVLICKRRLSLRNYSNCSGSFIKIGLEEFTVDTNGSIVVHSTKNVYPPGRFVMSKNGVLICVDYATSYSRSVTRTSRTLTHVTNICMLLSIISLAFLIITYTIFDELRTAPGINLMNLSTATLLAQILWVAGSGATGNPRLCAILAALMQYFFLACFVWASVIAFDTWRAFSAGSQRLHLSHSKNRKLVHSLRCMAVGWIPAIGYIAICLALDQSKIVAIGYGSPVICWINDGRANLYFFGIPIAVSLCINAVLYVLTVKAIHASTDHAFLLNQSQNRRRFAIYVRIGSLLGFTWVFGFVAGFGLDFLWYPFVVLNGLQGVYITGAFGLSKRARGLYRDLFGRRGLGRASTGCQNTKSSLLNSRKKSSTTTAM